MKNRFLVAALAALLFVSTPASASWETRVQWGRSLGVAVHTPNVLTTLASTPDVGVVLPVGTRTITVCVATNPVNYFHSTTTAPTSTLGLKLEVGCWALPNDPRLIETLRFIDTTAGASTVTVEFYGESN